MALNLGTNSYATVAEANEYFADNISFSQWDALTDDVKSRALVTASKQISLFVIEDCKLPIEGAISQSLKDAASEYALALSTNPAIRSQSDTGSNVERVRAGPVEIEFFRPSTGPRIPIVVTEILIGGKCIVRTRGITGSFSSGTSERSTFTSRDPFCVTEGFP